METARTAEAKVRDVQLGGVVSCSVAVIATAEGLRCLILSVKREENAPGVRCIEYHGNEFLIYWANSLWFHAGIAAMQKG